MKPLTTLMTLNELQTDMSILLASTTQNQVRVFGKKIIVKNNFITQKIETDFSILNQNQI